MNLSIRAIAYDKIQFMKIDAHVSIAGGVFNAPANAARIGAETFQIFSRSPRGGQPPELTSEVLTKFKRAMSDFGFSDFYIHAPYYINFAHTVLLFLHLLF